MHVRQELLVHAAGQVFQLVVDIGEIDEPVLVGVEDGEVAEHHHDVGDGARFDGGGDMGGVVGAGEGDVLDLDPVRLRPTSIIC